MKPLAALLLVCCAAGAIRAEVEFAGYIKIGGETKFVLVDFAEKKSSDWLPVGGSFAGYRVSDFDLGTETLLLDKNGVPTRLRLKAGRSSTEERREPVDLELARTGWTLSLMIRRFEETMAPAPKIKTDTEALNWWVDIFGAEIASAREKRARWREIAVRGESPGSPDINLQREFLRYLFVAAQDKRRAILASTVPNREVLLKAIDQHAATLRKELAEEEMLPAFPGRQPPPER